MVKKHPKGKGNTCDTCKAHPKLKEAAQMIQFGGSNTFVKPEAQKTLTAANTTIEIWKEHAGEKWYLSDDKSCAIFFDLVQNKWHLCDKDNLYYRGNNLVQETKGKMLPLKNISWYFDTGKSLKLQCNECKERGETNATKKSKCHKNNCNGSLHYPEKTKYATGIKSMEITVTKVLNGYEDLPEEINVEGGKLMVSENLTKQLAPVTVTDWGRVNGVYKLCQDIKPVWFKKSALKNKNSNLQMKQFGGSNEVKALPSFELNDWRTHAGEKWYVSETNKNCVIFFDTIQRKWHLCDEKELYYRGNSFSFKESDKILPFEQITWYNDTGSSLKGECSECKQNKVAKNHTKLDGTNCGGAIEFAEKPIFAIGVPTISVEIPTITEN